MYDLGFRIKEIRTRRGLNQKELAQRINKSKSAVCGYETNAQVPPLEVLVSIASVLNVSLDYLVGFEETESFSTRSLSDQQKKIAGLLLMNSRIRQMHPPDYHSGKLPLSRK